MTNDVEVLIQIIRSLPPEQQERVHQALTTIPFVASDEQADGELEFKERLRKAGLLKVIKPVVTELDTYRNRTPFEIEGGPLSETVIEERR